MITFNVHYVITRLPPKKLDLSIIIRKGKKQIYIEIVNLNLN